ncbi:MAG: T9SS type A sorting domain-containing protein, partial [Bacteroidota bacterium]
GIYIISVVGCPPISAFFETHEISCDSTLLVPGLGYPTWVTPEIVQPPKHGEASLSLDSSLWHTLKYVPEAGFEGTDTVVVECAHATQITCETGIYIIHVTCVNVAPETKTDEHWRIFPNPNANGFLTVESNLPVQRVRLQSLTGEVILDEKQPALPLWLELVLPEISPGIYWLEVFRKDEKSVKKLVVVQH